MNPFQRHGIRHLSPSSLNLFIESPGIWALRYLGRTKDGGNPKMWRGNAVEAGYAAYLRKGDFEQALKHARTSYETALRDGQGQQTGANYQGTLLEPMLKQCSLWEPPSTLLATQIEVQYWFDDVPVPIDGYVDLAFEGVDVDLKTTEKLPSKPTWSHVRQVSLYRAARQRKGGLLYVTDKKHAYYEVTDEMRDEALAELHDAALKLGRLLSAFATPVEVMGVLPIDYGSWRSPSKDAAPGPGRPDAAADFTAVDLETQGT